MGPTGNQPRTRTDHTSSLEAKTTEQQKARKGCPPIPFTPGQELEHGSMIKATVTTKAWSNLQQDPLGGC